MHICHVSLCLIRSFNHKNLNRRFPRCWYRANPYIVKLNRDQIDISSSNINADDFCLLSQWMLDMLLSPDIADKLFQHLPEYAHLIYIFLN